MGLSFLCDSRLAMALEHLSERDKAVLRSIFDPTATIAADVVEDVTDKFVEDDGE